MTDVLILGGTGWLSGRIAERWMDAGASVTCLARGTRPVPYGARLVVAALGAAGFSGTVNAVGDPSPLPVMLAAAREASGHTGEVVPAAPDWLAAQGVQHWMGPRSLPLWLPDDMPGFATRSNAVYRMLGGALRPLRETLVRTLEDERARGLDRARSAGIAREDELALIAALRSGGDLHAAG